MRENIKEINFRTTTYSSSPIFFRCNYYILTSVIIIIYFLRYKFHNCNSVEKKNCKCAAEISSDSKRKGTDNFFRNIYIYLTCKNLLISPEWEQYAREF